MDIKIDPEQLSAITRMMVDLPGDVRRARVSALKSTGYMIQRAARGFVEGGGDGWPGLHPMTQVWKAKRVKGGGRRAAWIKQRSRKGPVFWLGKFARYRVDTDGQVLQIDFGKSKKGQPGTFDRELVGIVRRVQAGEKTPVTDRTRRFFAATRRRRPKKQTAGQTYFPLKKTTTRLVVPPRPIFDPVWASQKPNTLPRFEDKFWAALNRYWSNR